MKYQFPYITHINDVLPAIQGRDEFLIAEREHYTVINYMVAMTDTFPEVRRKVGDTWEEDCDAAIRRECRGLIFDNVTGEITRRPFHKFFNISEKDETQIINLDFNNNYDIYDKLDGSMVTAFEVRKGSGNIRFATKMGITEVAMQAEVFVAKHTKYMDFSKWCIENNLTPIFEWCSRKQRIVVDYPEDNLTLLAARHMITGEYIRL